MTAVFTDLAEQAHGSVMLKYGETIVLATVCMSHDSQKGLGYFNLTVDYAEKFYAAGKILGSRFVRREGKPSEDAILASRVIDRTLRPLFDQYIRHAVQVIVTVISVDDNDPTILAVNAASLALATSDIPWGGPVAAVRIGKQVGEFVINPTYTQRVGASLDMLACGKDGTINMIEVGANEAGEDVLMQALEKANEELQKIQKFQEKIVAEIGQKKKEIKNIEIPEDLKKLFEAEIAPKLQDLIGEAGKKKIYELEDKWFEILAEKLPLFRAASRQNKKATLIS